MRPFALGEADATSMKKTPWAATTPTRRIVGLNDIPPPPTTATTSAEEMTDVDAKPDGIPKEAMAHFEALKAALGAAMPQEAAKMLQQTLSTKKDQEVTPALVYKVSNAKKGLDKAKEKVRFMDSTWATFRQNMTQRIEEQKKGYPEGRAAAMQVVKEKEAKLMEAQMELKLRATSMPAEDEDDELLQAALQESSLQAALEVDEVEMLDDAEGDKVATNSNYNALRPFGASRSPTKRKADEAQIPENQTDPKKSETEK